MQTVVIVIHRIVVVFMIGLILVQRSEGGALGIGGGGGNFMSARGQANVLTRSTTILAAAFFLTSLVLSLIARYGDNPSSILDQIGGPPAVQNPVAGQELPSTEGGLLDSLPGQLPSTSETPAEEPSGPQVPTSQ